MKYFNKNKQVIKAQYGIEFLMPRQEPVVDNMGGLGSGVVYNQRLIKLQQAKEELAKLQIETAQRPQAQLKADTDPRSYEQREKDARRQQFQQNVNEQRSNLYSTGRPNTEASQTAVLMLPYVAEAGRQYFSRPAGEIISEELSTLNHTLNPLVVSDDMLQTAREQSRQGHPLHAMGLGALGFGSAAIAASPLKAPVSTAVTATRPVVQRAGQAVKSGVQQTANVVRNVGEQVGEGLRNFGNQVQEGFNYTFGQGPMLQPAYVGGVPGTMRTPWTLYEPAATAPRTLNAISLGPVEISHQGIHRKPGRLGKPAESTSASGTTSTTVEHPAPKGILVVDRRGNKKPVFKEGSKEVPVYSDLEVTHTAERPVYGEEQYNEFISPVLSGTTYGGIEFVPGAKPVQRTRTVQTGTEPYEYTTTERVLTGTENVPNGELESVLNDEVLNPATTYYNTKGKQLKKVRTNTGFGYYNLTTGTYQPFSFGDKVLNHYALHPIRAGVETVLLLSPIVARLTGKGMAQTVNKVTHVVGEEAKRTWLGNEEVDRQNAERAAVAQEAAERETRAADSTRAVNEARERASESVSSTLDLAQALGNLFKKQ